MFLQHTGRNGCDPFADLALWIIKSPEHTRSYWAGFDTGRLFVAFDAMIAPRAFVGVACVGIDESNTIRTRLDAVCTPDTAIGIDQFNTFRRCERCMDGTHLIAGSIDTLIAQFRCEIRTFHKIRIDRRNIRTSVTSFRNQIDLNSTVFEVHKPLNPCS